MFADTKQPTLTGRVCAGVVSFASQQKAESHQKVEEDFFEARLVLLVPA